MVHQMDVGKKTQNLKGSAPASPSSTTFTSSFRNLKKGNLAGVIFGCTDSTMKECLSKQLFGLPFQHLAYVKNIEPGLLLFLFNYSKRELHGIFEAASPGQMNIDPYGWTSDGSQRTSFPAQVQVHVKKKCHPLVENQFASIIKENYFTNSRFWFELDHVQVSKLISLFSNQVVSVTSSTSVLGNTGNWQIVKQNKPRLETRDDEGNIPFVTYVNSTSSNQSNGHLSPKDPTSCLEGVNHGPGAVTEVIEKDETQQIYEKLQKLATSEASDSSLASQVQEPADTCKMQARGDGSGKTETTQVENISDNSLMMQDLLKAFEVAHVQEICQMKQRLHELESEVQLLRNRCWMLESRSNHSEADKYETIMESCCEQHLDPGDIIFIVGGCDGKSWLSSLDSYSPSKDIIKSLKPMSSIRSYTSLAKLNGNLYVIGGGNNFLWYDTVESYNPVNDDWTSLPCLHGKKGSLAAATLHDKIFAIGGGNGVDCFSDVEMFDLDVGRWISARSMLQKRFALAAVELNGALYAVGGFDGKDYLRSAERFDPREHSWMRLESMNASRGSHSLVTLNEKLYAIGGWDGNTMVPSVEVYDPRHGKWMAEAPMNNARGYSAAVALGNSLYVIGGVDGTEKIVEKVEQFKVGHGWQVTNLKAIGRRCFASAIVW